MELLGLKNPSAKVFWFETRVSPSLMGLSGVMVSRETQIRKRRERSNINTDFNKDLAGFMVFPMKIVGHEITNI